MNMSELFKDLRSDVKSAISLGDGINEFFDKMEPMVADMIMELKTLNSHMEEVKEGVKAIDELNKNLKAFTGSKGLKERGKKPK